MDGKIFVLTIQRWHAAIPKDWNLEIEEDGEFKSAAGREIIIYEGARLRGGPENAIKNMLADGFIREA